MVCNCAMAGTSACKNCINNYTNGSDYEYPWGKTFHIDLPDISKFDFEKYIKRLNDIPEEYHITVDELKEIMNCNNCQHYHIAKMDDGTILTNYNYCKKGINAASPSFYCAKWVQKAT